MVDGLGGGGGAAGNSGAVICSHTPCSFGRSMWHSAAASLAARNALWIAGPIEIVRDGDGFVRAEVEAQERQAMVVALVFLPLRRRHSWHQLRGDLDSAESLCRKRTFADSATRCIYLCEIRPPKEEQLTRSLGRASPSAHCFMQAQPPAR